MPPRGFVVAIVAFWAAMSCVLIQKEIVPRWRAGLAPPYTIEVTDEAGSPQVEWQVFRKDKQIGRGTTQIRRQPDRTFEMSQRFRFDEFQIHAFFSVFDVKKLNSAYRVTHEGKLLAFNASCEGSLAHGGNGLSFDINAEVACEVRDGFMEPRIKAFGNPVELGLGAIAVDDNGSVLNPMHLLHRLPRLREGQRWQVPLLDPLKAFTSKEIFGQKLPAFASRPTFLEAEVTRDEYTWNRELVDCLRVTYREPGKDEIARTWVRRADGLVLAQEAKDSWYDLSIRRIP